MTQQLQLSSSLHQASKQNKRSTPYVFVVSPVIFDSQLLEINAPVHRLPISTPDLQLDHINNIVPPSTPFIWVGVPKIGHSILQRLMLLHTSVLLLLDDPLHYNGYTPTEYQITQMCLWVRRLVNHHDHPQIHMA